MVVRAVFCFVGCMHHIHWLRPVAGSSFLASREICFNLLLVCLFVVWHAVVGGSVKELLHEARRVLKLTSRPRALYAHNGERVHTFQRIEKGMELWVSCGEDFKPENYVPKVRKCGHPVRKRIVCACRAARSSIFVLHSITPPPPCLGYRQGRAGSSHVGGAALYARLGRQVRWAWRQRWRRRRRVVGCSRIGAGRWSSRVGRGAIITADH